MASHPFPPGGPGPTPPRSTPIPGQGPVTPPPFTQPPFSRPPFAQEPFEQPTGATGLDGDPVGYRPPKRGGGRIGWLIGAVVVLAVVAGVGGAILALRAGSDASDRVDAEISAAPDDAEGDSGAEGSSDTEEADVPVDLWDPSVARAFAEQYDAAVPGDPTRFVEIAIYTDYAFAEAQDPDESDHVDRYDWRNGRVGDPDPLPNEDDLEGRTFTIDEVPWDRLGALMAQAETELDIDDARTRYILIDKGSFGREGLGIRLYVSGPRESGYVLADADATVVTVYGG